jgi:hypothetical protein
MKLYSADDIKDIVNENKELREYASKLTSTNLKLQEDLEVTKSKLKHLEDIAKFTESPIAVGTNEEELCKLEISRLYQAAKRAPLEFNEVKAFEIYVKSLMLIRGKSVVEDKKSSKKESKLTNDQLLQLALQVVDDNAEQ